MYVRDDCEYVYRANQLGESSSKHENFWVKIFPPCILIHVKMCALLRYSLKNSLNVSVLMSAYTAMQPRNVYDHDYASMLPTEMIGFHGLQTE